MPTNEYCGAVLKQHVCDLKVGHKGGHACICGEKFTVAEG